MTQEPKASSVYSEILTRTRFRDSKANYSSIMLAAESDRGRLLFCPAFRRLQQKAQVFSLETNAAVRSRLTHSLEVSQTGRHIADNIVIELIKKGLADSIEGIAFTTFVETACLMHDIGNTPFGHFGEAAISEWFGNIGPEILYKLLGTSKNDATQDQEAAIEKALADFKNFDGNPQGIRVVAKLQRNSDEFGLNLTMTTIAAYLKYVRDPLTQADTLKSPHTAKCGYFKSERDLIEKVWKEFKYKKPQRHPLAYVMEAADDIAYCISDLEDSIEKGLVDKKSAFTHINEKWEPHSQAESKETLEITNILQWALEEKNRTTMFIPILTSAPI